MLVRMMYPTTPETNTRPVGSRIRSSADPAKICRSSVKAKQDT
jgi:hypothetical protein